MRTNWTRSWRTTHQLPWPTVRVVDDQVDVLTRINTAEFVGSLGLGWLNWGSAWWQMLCRPAARRISVDMARFDHLFGSMSLRRAARQVLGELVGELVVCGADRVPLDGPLLIAANHPGLCDVLTILATVAREDLIVVAADYPLLRALRGINSHFLFVPRSPELRRTALNHIIAHLRSGGAVLLLPAGEIEPDPAVSNDAIAALDAWSPSLGLIARRVADITIVPAVLSGALLPTFQRHPLTWIRRRKSDRQQLGTMLQVLARASRAARVRLDYGQPLTQQGLVSQGATAQAVTGTVVASVRTLMLELEHGRAARKAGNRFRRAVAS